MCAERILGDHCSSSRCYPGEASWGQGSEVRAGQSFWLFVLSLLSWRTNFVQIFNMIFQQTKVRKESLLVPHQAPGSPQIDNAVKGEMTETIVDVPARKVLSGKEAR